MKEEDRQSKRELLSSSLGVSRCCLNPNIPWFSLAQFCMYEGPACWLLRFLPHNNTFFLLLLVTIHVLSLVFENHHTNERIPFPTLLLIISTPAGKLLAAPWALDARGSLSDSPVSLVHQKESHSSYPL